MELQPPKISVSTYEPLDRKQQEIIIMKSKLVTQMREKEEDLQKEEEEEEKYWEEQIHQKEKILMKLEEQVKNSRLELHSQKVSMEKPDYSSLDD